MKPGTLLIIPSERFVLNFKKSSEKFPNLRFDKPPFASVEEDLRFWELEPASSAGLPVEPCEKQTIETVTSMPENPEESALESLQLPEFFLKRLDNGLDDDPTCLTEREFEEKGSVGISICLTVYLNKEWQVIVEYRIFHGIFEKISYKRDGTSSSNFGHRMTIATAQEFAKNHLEKQWRTECLKSYTSR